MAVTWFENKKALLSGFALGILAPIAVGLNVANYRTSIQDSRTATLRQMEFERQESALALSASYADPQQVGEFRKIAHSSDFELVVASPTAAIEKVRLLTESFGGYLVASQISGTDGGSASITVRIPVARAEQGKTEIRQLAVRIDSEKTEAEDVTKQWVDTDAHLHNLRASEQQYLQILKRATTVHDTVEVTDKLSEIRGQIEQQQAEFALLSKRVETVAISIELRADDDVKVLGLHWRPLYRAKLAVREAIDAIGDYAATMFEFAVHIPVILLWLATAIGFAAIGWRLFRWTARVFFGWKLEPKS